MNDMIDLVATYITEVQRKRVTGEAREHAYRVLLEALIKEIDSSLTDVINDPKHSKYGAPDFVLLRGELEAGHIEAKDIGVNLDKVETTDQMARYFGYPNLILTDYLEFRFYRNGEKYCEPIRVASLNGEGVIGIPDRYMLLARTLQDFLETSRPKVKSGGHLAKIMGGMARRIRDTVRMFLEEPEKGSEDLVRLHEAVKKLLIDDLSYAQFADLYAQTLVYGLFAARYNDRSPESFSRQEARDLLPRENPFLRDFFDHIAGASFDRRLEWPMDELCRVFAHADVHTLLNDFYSEHTLWGETVEARDPVIHFYEDFLHEYDPQQKVDLGVFYTPLPVVRFIIRSVDELLRRDFGLEKGLADESKITLPVEVQGRKRKVDVHRVQILDPATGTGTFLKECILHIRKAFAGQGGLWPVYVRDHLIPRLHGFERMMASYTVAHLKLQMELEKSGAAEVPARLNVYLTDSLAEPLETDEKLFGVGFQGTLTREGIDASRIKRELPIMVVIGNPPYSGESNNPHFHGHDAYKVEPGGKDKLKERNSKWLNDDYVKFIRLAESLIEKNEEGIIGMITAHGWLDNPTFRGMRWHLMETFDTLYVLDLHGNANKKETAPDGSKDANVFDIRQGVAIVLAVKKGKKGKKPARVYRADLFGPRAKKFDALNSASLDNLPWQEIAPALPNLEFAASDQKLKKEYQKGFSVNELFPLSGVGIVSARDHFVIGDDSSTLIRNAERYRSSEAKTREVLCAEVGVSDKKGWDALNAREMLRKEAELEKYVEKIAYRPFDTKKIFYHPALVWRTVDKVMKHFLKGENVGLDICRQTIGADWNHIFVTNRIVDDSYVSNRSRERGYVLPLYVYADDGSRAPNLAPTIVKEIQKVAGKEVSPEDVLDYVYAHLHAPSYRVKYKEFLKSDFPRVPYPASAAQFAALAGLGRKLRALHLLEDSSLRDTEIDFDIPGGNIVDSKHPKFKDGRVYINDSQYFGNVPEEAWTFWIGGYQPAQKWLKDRRSRGLSADEIVHYQKMIATLSETPRLMAEIDREL